MAKTILNEHLVIRKESPYFFRLLIPEEKIEPVVIDWKGQRYTYPSTRPQPILEDAFLRRRILSRITEAARERILRETIAGHWILSDKAGRNTLWRAFEVIEGGGRFIGFRIGLFDRECAEVFEKTFC